MVHSRHDLSAGARGGGPDAPRLIVTGAMLMGFGYWTFIANVFLTVFKRRGGRACTA